MLSYVLAGVGLSLAAASMWVLVKRGVNHRVANATLAKVAITGGVERMRKLLRVVDKGTYFDAIHAAVDAGVAAGTREPGALATAVEAAYDKAGLEVAARWKAHADRGLFGVILVGAGLGLAVTNDSWPTPVLVMCAAGAMVGSYLVMKRRDVIEALIDGRVRILPPLVEVLRGGAAAGPAATPEPLAPGEVRVRIHRGDTFVRSQTLDLEVIKIGRLPSAHLHLDDDEVSRLHAVIESSAEGVVVVDLGSSSGTLVNGDKINKKALRSGDVIGIGPFRIEVHVGPS